MSLHSMPGPEDLGPFGAYLVSDGFGWCRGQVLFAGGSEVAVVDEPHLLEVVRSDDVVSLAGVLGAVVPRAFAVAETNQASAGGGNPRFGPIFDEPAPADLASAHVRSCVFGHRPSPCWPRLVAAALEARSVTCHRAEVASGFVDAADALLAAVVRSRRPDRRRGRGALGASAVAVRDGGLAADAGRTRRDRRGHARRQRNWDRAAADYAAQAARPVRLVTLTDAVTAAGREPRPGLGPAGAAPRRLDPKGASRPSLSPSRLRRRPPPHPPVPSSPICSPTPRPPRWPGPSWWWGRAGSDCAVTPDRPAASPTAVPPSPPGSTPRSATSSEPTTVPGTERGMTARPRGSSTPMCTPGTRSHRLVPVPGPSSRRRRW